MNKLYVLLLGVTLVLGGCFRKEADLQTTDSRFNRDSGQQAAEENQQTTGDSGQIVAATGVVESLSGEVISTGSVSSGVQITTDTKTLVKPDPKVRTFYVLSGDVLEKVASNKVMKGYQSLRLDDTTIYYKNEKELKDFSDFGCGVLSLEKSQIGSCFSYTGGKVLLEIKNINRVAEGSKEYKGDIYDEGLLLVSQMSFGCYDGCQYPEFDKEAGIVSVSKGRGDVCAGWSKYTEYNIRTKQYFGNSRSSNGCFVDNETIAAGYEGPDHPIVEIYSYEPEGQTGKNAYSIFSIRQGNSNKNYIYNSSLKLETKENFLTKKSEYIYSLGGKELKLNFADLTTKMPFLYGGANPGENFEYAIYLQKNGADFSLNFDYIGDKQVFGSPKKTIKNIGVVSCKENNSKEYDTEYILKNKTAEGDYRYGIAEKWNNKCDIPYKINAYYTDGTKETGEYYILFDY